MATASFVDYGPGDWGHPDYTGSDPAYAAWLAGADLSASDTKTRSKLRRQQLDGAYKQALADLDKQGVNGRRTIQSNMLSRGIFRSGETDRRKTEYDAAIADATRRAGTSHTDALGAVDDSERSALANLATQGTTQMSQAMLRDALTAYQKQQADLAAASVPVAAYAPAAAPSYAAPSSSYTAPTYKPPSASVQQQAIAHYGGGSAGISNASSLKPKPAIKPMLKVKGIQ